MQLSFFLVITALELRSHEAVGREEEVVMDLEMELEFEFELEFEEDVVHGCNSTHAVEERCS